jgi:FKBP12-rapamycin complex-associated protein
MKSKERIRAHLVPAVQGFVRSIALSAGANLQDTLRLLTLWFNYGADKQVELALIDGFNTLPIDTWLQVIPQLIARIHSPISAVRRLLHQLLIRVGKEHPQALVFPLTVASKSQSAPRTNNAADLILKEMRQQASAALVDQALLVSQELIRVAILWHELWYEGLEDASRFYFGDHNVEGMFDTLAPLHQLLEKGPETQREASFQQAFGRELQEAFEWCKVLSSFLWRSPPLHLSLSLSLFPSFVVGSVSICSSPHSLCVRHMILTLWNVLYDDDIEIHTLW